LAKFRVSIVPGLARAQSPVIMALLVLLLLVSAARGDDEDLRSLEVFNGAKTELISSGRSLRPTSQTAENTTVVTSREIEALNAHTLADILVDVPGIQLEAVRTPGTAVNIEIQGSNFNHVLVLIDDVPLNNLGDNYPDIAAIPAQIIERVEIIKGAASTAWGSALGGVVNVITKSPQSERPFAGTVSGSLGSKTTADTRAEISGTRERFGYYLAGGNLRSDGLLANNMINKNTVYGKLHYEFPVRGGVTLTTLYTDVSSGIFASPERDVKQDQQGHQVFSTLSLQYPLADHFLLEATSRLRLSDQRLSAQALSDRSGLGATQDDEVTGGGSLKLSWVSELQRIAAGVDYDHERLHVSNPLIQVDAEQLIRSAERVGVFLNDTFTLGDFAVTPSARYDHTGTGDDLFSPSFGVTYAVTENTVLRGYTSRGYSLTSLNRTDSTEKVWTSQVGVESGDIPYLWLKGTLFRNDTWNISDNGRNPDIKNRQLKQGVEVEARTLPVWNTSLSAGYTFINATEKGSVVHGVPRHTLDIGIKYQDRSSFRALLNGRYLDWNDHSQNGRYAAPVWDLHLGKGFSYSEHGSLEVFVSLRNLFNSGQYISDIFKNPGRWGEAGVRCSF
jgi:vitamin B12 transporter